MPRDVMRIGILAKGGADWIGGAYYVVNLVRALRSLPAPERPEIFLLVAEPQQVDLLREIAPFAELCQVPVVDPEDVSPGRPVRRPAATSAPTVNPALVRLLANKQIDLIYPCMRSLGEDFPRPWLPWIPDLQHRAHPEHFDADERRRRDEQHQRIAQDARLIVLSSQAAGDEFERAHPGVGERLRVLRFTTVPQPEWYAEDPRHTARRFELPARYLILPNQFWVHKNHRLAFEAMRILARNGMDACLVCTGWNEDPRRPTHAAELRNFIEQHGLAGRIRILGLLPRQVQVQLLRAATAVVQPSLFEGWSTVVEDARALGKPILLSDIPVHREQAPARGVYFDPRQAESLAAAIARAWPTLPAGPYPAAEEQALADQQQRVIAYGRAFLRIGRELLDTWGRN